MSMNKYTVLLTGVRLKSKVNKELGIDLNDEHWEQFMEGRLDVELRLIYGEGSEFYYFGIVLAESEPYSDAQNAIVRIPHPAEVSEKLNAAGVPVSVSGISTFFFDYWM